MKKAKVKEENKNEIKRGKKEARMEENKRDDGGWKED